MGQEFYYLLIATLQFLDTCYLSAFPQEGDLLITINPVLLAHLAADLLAFG
jgi:hypothetical protein